MEERLSWPRPKQSPIYLLLRNLGGLPDFSCKRMLEHQRLLKITRAPCCVTGILAVVPLHVV